MNLRIRIYIFQLPAENVVNFLRVLYSFKSSLSKFYIINNYYSAMNRLFNYGYYKRNYPMLIRLIINKRGVSHVQIQQIISGGSNTVVFGHKRRLSQKGQGWKE